MFIVIAFPGKPINVAILDEEIKELKIAGFSGITNSSENLRLFFDKELSEKDKLDIQDVISSHDSSKLSTVETERDLKTKNIGNAIDSIKSLEDLKPILKLLARI